MFNKKTGAEAMESTTPNTDPKPQATPKDPGAPNPAASGASTVLAEGSKFVGKAEVAGTLRVEGRAEGNLDATDVVVVGKSGDVKAKVSTRRAVLNGAFNGEIKASDRVELQSGSRVEADINAKNMVMEDGVSFSGNCKIGK